VRVCESVNVCRCVCGCVFVCVVQSDILSPASPSSCSLHQPSPSAEPRVSAAPGVTPPPCSVRLCAPRETVSPHTLYTHTRTRTRTRTRTHTHTHTHTHTSFSSIQI